MTNKEQLELIAQAWWDLIKEIALINYWLEGTDEVWTSQYAKDRATWTRRTVTTHLAEIDELKEEIRITEDFGIEGEAETLKHKLLTKAKRLLGVE